MASCTKQSSNNSAAVVVPTYDQFATLLDDIGTEELPSDHAVLQALNMKSLLHYYEEYEEGDCLVAYYGVNAEVKKSEDPYRMYDVVTTADHAIVLYVCLASDNTQILYFSEEEDMQQFKAAVPADKLEEGYWEFDYDADRKLYYASVHY